MVTTFRFHRVSASLKPFHCLSVPPAVLLYSFCAEQLWLWEPHFECSYDVYAPTELSLNYHPSMLIVLDETGRQTLVHGPSCFVHKTIALMVGNASDIFFSERCSHLASVQ